MVSTETGTPSFSALRTTGRTRASSSSTAGAARARTGRFAADVEHVGAFGHQPFAMRERGAGLACKPPSENESGVTLTMPITLGPVKLDAKARGLPVHVAVRTKNGAEAPSVDARHDDLRRSQARRPD